MIYVFVYGTLRKGERAEAMMNECKLIGRARFDGRFQEVLSPATGERVRATKGVLTLPGHDGFPALVTSRLGDAQEHDIAQVVTPSIIGEVYQLPEEKQAEVLADLDRYEGYPRLYGRTNIAVQLDSGHRVAAYTYFMLLPPNHLTDFRVITSGDWKDREDTVPYMEYMLDRAQGEQRVVANGGVRWMDVDAILRGERINFGGNHYDAPEPEMDLDLDELDEGEN